MKKQVLCFLFILFTVTIVITPKPALATWLKLCNEGKQDIHIAYRAYKGLLSGYTTSGWSVIKPRTGILRSCIDWNVPEGYTTYFYAAVYRKNKLVKTQDSFSNSLRRYSQSNMCIPKTPTGFSYNTSNQSDEGCDSKNRLVTSNFLVYGGTDKQTLNLDLYGYPLHDGNNSAADIDKSASSGTAVEDPSLSLLIGAAVLSKIFSREDPRKKIARKKEQQNRTQGLVYKKFFNSKYRQSTNPKYKNQLKSLYNLFAKKHIVINRKIVVNEKVDGGKYATKEDFYFVYSLYSSGKFYDTFAMQSNDLARHFINDKRNDEKKITRYEKVNVYRSKNSTFIQEWRLEIIADLPHICLIGMREINFSSVLKNNSSLRCFELDVKENIVDRQNIDIVGLRLISLSGEKLRITNQPMLSKNVIQKHLLVDW